MSTIAEHVAAAVAEILPALEDRSPRAVHAALWPYVSAAVGEVVAAPAPPARDRRVKPWQYTVRFWLQTPLGPELVGETDPDVMHGTGEIVPLVRYLASQLHECDERELPDELSERALKKRLPQLRNNIGRGASGNLRIEYAIGVLEPPDGGSRMDEYLLQVDIRRLE